jgi:hypothetical protein
MSTGELSRKRLGRMYDVMTGHIELGDSWSTEREAL